MKVKHFFTSKKFIVFIIICAFLTCISGSIILYKEYCYPVLFKEFNKYDGLNFDYSLEENDYKDKLYYKQLSENEKLYYRCMYHAAKNGKNEYKLNFEINSDDEYRARMAFGLDYPEYYWFGDDVIFDVDYVTDKIGLLKYYYSKVTSDCYNFGLYDITKNNKLIEEKLAEVLPTLKGKDDYETIYNVYKYIIENTAYNYDYFYYSDIRSCLLFNKAVCSSYAESFQLICNRLGYECYSVQGRAVSEKDNLAVDSNIDNTNTGAVISEDSLHEWNIIRINDNWYWVDPTWGDTYYYSLDDSKKEIIDLTYFLSSDEIFSIDHLKDDFFDYPKCNDDSLYLAKDKGLILDYFDKAVIEGEVLKAFQNNRDDIIFQFKTKEHADQLIDWIDNRNLFAVYRDNISRYYQASMNYYQNSNYSIYIYWNFTNLY